MESASILKNVFILPLISRVNSLERELFEKEKRVQLLQEQNANLQARFQLEVGKQAVIGPQVLKEPEETLETVDITISSRLLERLEKEGQLVERHLQREKITGLKKEEELTRERIRLELEADEALLHTSTATPQIDLAALRERRQAELEAKSQKKKKRKLF